MTAPVRSRSAIEESQETTERLLTPAAQAALLGINALHANLQVWRGLMDAMRDSARRQQDAMLQMVLRRSGAGGAATEASEAPNGVSQSTSDFLQPMLAARRAYVQMSGAMVDAQRETLAVLMRSTTGAASSADQPRH